MTLMKKYILVVDDEENILNSVSMVLKMANYEVETAKNGKEALDKVNEAQKKDRPVDLILTDILMPVMGGMDLMEKLNNENLKIPVIVVSGHGDNNTLLEAVHRGCEGFIFKPIQLSFLARRIDNFFDKQLVGNCK